MASGSRAEGASGGGERFPSGRRLRRRREFLETYEMGQRAHGRFVIVFASPVEGERPRLGVSVTRKVGIAAVRNRLRRQVREIFRRSPVACTVPPCRLVVNVSPRAAGASFSELRDEIERLIARAAGPPR